MAYRFAGEVVDIEELLKRGAEAPPPTQFVPEKGPSNNNAQDKPPEPGRPGGIDIDPITGEPEGIDDTAPKM